MGDRANVRIPQTYGEGSIYLYTHWGGLDCTTRAVARALVEVPGRWDDESYLARAIFVRMIDDQGGGWMDETSFGIATYPPDNENPILTVDCKSQTVTIGKQKPISFEDFAKRHVPQEQQA